MASPEQTNLSKVRRATALAALARDALDRARDMPPGDARSAALRKAGDLRIIADQIEKETPQ